MNISQSLPETHRANRRFTVVAVAVTLLAGVATAFVVFHHRPTQAGEARLASAPGMGLETAAAYVDVSLPAATEVFAQSPANDEESCPTF